MSELGRRAVVAFAALAVLFGVVAQRPGAGGRLSPAADDPAASEVLVDVAPVGVVPAAARPRTSLDSEMSPSATSTKLRVSGLVLVLTVLATAGAVRRWRLVLPDQRLDVRLRRWSPAPLRAPPIVA